MDGKEINIVVTGEAASGKTAIAELIKEALKKKGFTNVTYVNTEDKPMNKMLKNKRLEAIIKKEPSITIFEVQVKRNVAIKK